MSLISMEAVPEVCMRQGMMLEKPSKGLFPGQKYYVGNNTCNNYEAVRVETPH